MLCYILYSFILLRYIPFIDSSVRVYDKEINFLKIESNCYRWRELVSSQNNIQRHRQQASI